MPRPPTRLPARVRPDGGGNRNAVRPPPPGPRAPRKPAAVSPEQVAAAFVNPVKPVRASPVYRFVSAIVAGFVLLLPAAYLALIAAVGWGVYWHFTENVGLLSMGRGRARVFMAAVYVLPGLAGGAAVLALLKPLAAREGGRDQWRTLHRKTQPTLFALADLVCEAVRAPKPDKIHVDAEVNMSASHRGGFLGLFGGQFVLTVGVPLAAGLSAAGFAGVLAHEFGHFAQRGGRGLSRAAGAVQSWLARTVYKRDAVDEWLAEACEDEGWFSLLAMVCVACVWLVRQILTAFLYAGAAATAALARQMEFDADRYETRLAGPDAFAHTSRRMIELSLGFDRAGAEVLGGLASQSPPADLPALCVHHAPRLSEAQALEEEAEMRSHMGLLGRLMVSHPPTGRRLAAARREGARLDKAGGPALKLDGPAADLFADLPALCRDVTRDLYRGRFRLPAGADLAPVRPLPKHPHRPDRPPTSRKDRGDAAEGPAAAGPARREPDDAPAVRPLPYGRATLEVPSAGHKNRVRELADAAAASAGELETALKKYDRASARRGRALAKLAAAGFTPAAHADGAGDLVTLTAKLEKATAARDEAELMLADLERAPAAARLAALDLFAAPAVAAKLPGHVRAGVEELLAFSEAARAARPASRAVGDAAVRLAAALRADASPHARGGFAAELNDRAAALAEALAGFRAAFAAAPDPHAVPESLKEPPEDRPVPFAARLPDPAPGVPPALLLPAAATAVREAVAGVARADELLQRRATWIARRLKLAPAPAAGESAPR